VAGCVDVTRFWLGDRLVEPDAAKVSVLDHGFTVGDGVFETIVVRGGVAFALSRHLDRLRRSLSGMGLAGPAPSLVREAVDAVLASAATADGLELGRLRITVTSGEGPIGSVRGPYAATLVVALAPMVAPEPTAVIATVPWVRNERSPIAGVKSTSYAENAVALASARSRGASEAVLANTVGSLCEGTGSNVFVVVDGEVLTPPLTSGALNGVTRQLVLEWCGGVVPLREETLGYDVLHTADEVFLTSSTRDVQPVVQLVDPERGRALPAGPVTAQVAAQFAARAASQPDP
jgi:branched-chain amino acid aminotransferase